MKKIFSFVAIFFFSLTTLSSVSAFDVHTRFMTQCIASGDTKAHCNAREKRVRSDMTKLKKEKRMAFVRMIIASKRYCRAEHADAANARLCFRIHVRDGVKEMILALRNLKKQCHRDGKIGIEVSHCAYLQYLDSLSEKKSKKEESNESEDKDSHEKESESEKENSEEESNESEEESTLEFHYTFDEKQNVTLLWETKNIASCTASSSPENTEWNGEVSANGGEKIIANVDEKTTFTISCTPNIEGESDIVLDVEVDTTQ